MYEAELHGWKLGSVMPYAQAKVSKHLVSYNEPTSQIRPNDAFPLTPRHVPNSIGNQSAGHVAESREQPLRIPVKDRLPLAV